MKFRILERHDGKFFIQQKGWFFWSTYQERIRDAWGDMELGDFLFDNLDDAKKKIEAIKAKKLGPKVKKIHVMDTELR